jgi:hypothetical protein
MRVEQSRAIRKAIVTVSAAATIALVAGCAQNAGSYGYSGDGGAYSERGHPYTAGASMGFGSAHSYPGVY